MIHPTAKVTEQVNRKEGRKSPPRNKTVQLSTPCTYFLSATIHTVTGQLCKTVSGCM